MKKTNQNLIILTVIFVISIVIANVVGARAVTTGKYIGSIEIAMSGGALTYAFTFLCTDVISQLWGKETAKKTVKYGFIGQVFATVMIMLTGALPASNAVMDNAYQTLLGSSWVFVLGSLAAYLTSQTWDVMVFHKLKDWKEEVTGDCYHGRWIWNNASTLTSQIIDTVIYAFISYGFGFGWIYTHEGRLNLIGIMIGQYLLKAALALLDTPFFYLLTRERQ